MNRLCLYVFLFSIFLFCCCAPPGRWGDGSSAAGVVWEVDNLKSIGEHKTTVLGSPKVVEGTGGSVVEFDGAEAGLVVEALPLAGAEKFTLEIIFRPDAKGLKEQRFLHLQEDGTESRVLIETRLTDGDLWYLDTYIHSARGSCALFEPAKTHPVGQWYSAALVYDGEEMSHYVDGVKEVSAKLALAPLGKGGTSIGVRMNRVFWFKGAIARVRFSRRVLAPKEFLKP